MKRVAVVHHAWPGFGGGERFVVSVIDALNSVGIEPDVYTLRRVEPSLLTRTFGKNLRFKFVPMKFRIPYHGYRFILYRKVAESILSVPRGYDIVFSSAIGEYVPLRLGQTLDNHTLYVFNPYHDWPIREYGIGWAYSKFYRALAIGAIRSMKGRILANSRFTAGRIAEVWGVKAKVVYSPVDVDSFSPPSGGPRRGIINVGRFSQEKRQHHAIYVASRIDADVQLTLVGSSVSPDTVIWLNKVKAFARSTSARVRFLTNLPFDQLREELWRAKVMLHTFPDEDLGLAPLEGIAAGCVPIVPDAGGNVETVPIRELRFRSLEDAVTKVEEALRGEFDTYLPQLRAHLELFAEDRFRAKLLSMLGLP